MDNKVLFFIVRAIYIHSGEYIVIDQIGMVWKRGTYSECKNWVRTIGGGDFSYYTIKRIR